RRRRGVLRPGRMRHDQCGARRACAPDAPGRVRGEPIIVPGARTTQNFRSVKSRQYFHAHSPREPRHSSLQSVNYRESEWRPIRVSKSASYDSYDGRAGIVVMPLTDSSEGFSGLQQWSKPLIFDRLFAAYCRLLQDEARARGMSRLHARVWRALIAGDMPGFEALREALILALDHADLTLNHLAEVDAEIMLELLEVVVSRYNRSQRTAMAYHLALMELAGRGRPRSSPFSNASVRSSSARWVMLGKSSSRALASGVHTSSTSSASGRTTPSIHLATAPASTTRKRASKRLGRPGGVIARARKSIASSAGYTPAAAKRAQAPG